MKLSLLTLLWASLILTACDSKKPRDEVVRREGQPDMVRLQRDDPEMNKAMQTARDTMDTFITALRARTATQANFSVKKPFKAGEKVEHIWLSDASFDGSQFSGRVDNEPVDVKSVKLGETATVDKNEISDWFYVDDGKLIGGYTIRVLYARMSPEEQKEFNTHVGFKLE